MRYAIGLVAGVVLASAMLLSQTAKPFEFRNAPEVKTPPVYSHAAIVNGGRLVFVSGQVGLDKDGKMPADFRAQAQNAFTNLKAVLAAAGATPQDVIKLNYYVVGLTQEKRMALRAAREQFAGPTHLPASTLAGVQALASEDIQVEIEAVAVVR